MSEKDLLLPDIGEFDNVEVIEIHVAAGDKVKPEDPILTLESDKATMDIPAPRAGRVAESAVKEGDKVSEGAPILTLSTGQAAAAVAAGRVARDRSGLPV